MMSFLQLSPLPLFLQGLLVLVALPRNVAVTPQPLCVWVMDSPTGFFLPVLVPTSRNGK